MCRLPDNTPLPTHSTGKGGRGSTARTTRRATVAPKAPMGVDDRSDDEDDEPPGGEVEICSASISVETDTSDTSPTSRMGAPVAREEPCR